MNRNLLIAGGVLLIGGGIAYYLIQQNGWPNGMVTCWKCEGSLPVSHEFPSGTQCGWGLAYEYPFNYMPTNCGGNGSNSHIASGTAMKMVYGQAVGPLDGVEIDITDNNTGITYSDVSDSVGYWEIEVPLDGIYTVVASKDNHKTHTTYNVDWSNYPGGPWDWLNFYSSLVYLFNYDLTWDWDGQNHKYNKTFYISDYDEWGAAGHVRLSGTVDLIGCTMGTIDIRKTTEFGSGEIFKQFYYQQSHFEINKTWDQPMEDKITAINIYGDCGIAPLSEPGLEHIDLKFERLY